MVLYMNTITYFEGKIVVEFFDTMLMVGFSTAFIYSLVLFYRGFRNIKHDGLIKGNLKNGSISLLVSIGFLMLAAIFVPEEDVIESSKPQEEIITNVEIDLDE